MKVCEGYKCKSKKPCLCEPLSFFCIECGRIWVNEFSLGLRRTDRFESVPKPVKGVWVGHTFVKNARMGSRFSLGGD